MNRSAVIIDSGGANIASLMFALQRLDCEPLLSRDANEIAAATHIILPGVGAAHNAMARLREARLDTLIPALKQPLLGICLGMQLLYEHSAEGRTDCLGVIPGEARRFSSSPDHPVPHMGWNRIQIKRDSPLLDGIAAGEHFYFVHSYALPVSDTTLASCSYGGEFSAVVNRGNFFGAQFHPERSAAAGARLLRNFLELR